MAQYFEENNFEQHLTQLKLHYGQQKIIMETAIKKYFPKNTQLTDPEGGLFLWCILSKKISTLELFQKAIQQKVAFVPGESFYTGNIQQNTMRLNYSCADQKMIEKGIRKLVKIIC